MDYPRIAEKHGTPVFLLDATRAAANTRRLRQALPGAVIYYSVKTNPRPAILAAVAAEGAGFDFSTLDELRAVQAASPTAPLVFNGPCKTREELKAALEAHALVNADSLFELNDITELQPGAKIGLRVSLAASKFGFEPTKIGEAFGQAEKLGLKPVALHSHPGTQQKNLVKYGEWLKKYAETAKKINESFPLREVNCGGGIPDQLTLTQNNLSVEDYANTVKNAFAGIETRLALEPGRFVCADSMKLLAKVVRIKEAWGKNYAACDAGINYLAAITLAQYKITQVVARQGVKKRFTVAGPLLFGNDVLGEIHADLREGDLLLVENVGAYCTQLAWNIGYGQPKVVEESSGECGSSFNTLS